MKRVIFCLTFLFISVNVISQELPSDKKFDFSEMLALNEKEEIKFVFFSFDLNQNHQLLSYTSEIIFPLEEEKETWKFGETENQYQPIIYMGNYQYTPKVANFNVYVQQYKGNGGNIAKPIKGYDLCMRPIY